MRNLEQVMALAAKCLLAWLDPDRYYFPAGGWEVAHDTGRWWDAMLRYENATGVRIPVQIEAAMLDNIKVLMDNPLGILFNNPQIDWLKNKAFLNPHNFREGMLTLAALVRYRDNDWARQTGHRFLTGLDHALQPDGRYDYDSMAARLQVPFKPLPIRVHPDETFRSGRALEAILCFYEATGDPLALSVAKSIAEHHLAATVNADGTIKPEIIAADNAGHNHSYLGTLRGLLRYGLLTSDAAYTDAVYRTYQKSIWQHNITWSGYAPHDLGRHRFCNQQGDPLGDPASCGDVAELALWLGLDAGHTELLDDVERLVRSRLLPAQLLDPADPRRDGAWGINDPMQGQSAILDVFAAVLHSLVHVYNQIVTRPDEQTIDINLHFDRQTPLADVCSIRQERACLLIRQKQPGRLRIHLPGWIPAESLVLSVNNQPARSWTWEGRFMAIPSNDAISRTIRLEYDLPVRQSTETMQDSGISFRFNWRGDEIVGCDPPIPIYPPLL